MSDDVWNDEYYTITYKGLLLLSNGWIWKRTKKSVAVSFRAKELSPPKIGTSIQEAKHKNNLSKGTRQKKKVWKIFKKKVEKNMVQNALKWLKMHFKHNLFFFEKKNGK